MNLRYFDSKLDDISGFAREVADQIAAFAADNGATVDARAIAKSHLLALAAVVRVNPKGAARWLEALAAKL